MPALVADGAIRADMGLHFHWHHHGVWKKRFDSKIAIILFTRAFLERRIAERVIDIPRVHRIEADVEGLLAGQDGHRIAGVMVRERGSEPTRLEADLVVDATGRGSQVPIWLTVLGRPAPAETTVRVDVTYASRLYRAPAERGWHALHVTPLPPGKRQGVAFAVEKGRMLVTLLGLHGERPPLDEGAFLDYARSLPVPDLHRAIADAEPLAPIVPYTFFANRRRHYEDLESFPDRLLVVGDALCSFNPLYGQGMTVGALEAAALDRILRETNDLTGLSRRFHKAVAGIVETPWRLTIGEDFRRPEVAGDRAAGTALLNWYTGRLHERSGDDASLALAFYRVMHMLEAPSALFRPSILGRVLRPQSMIRSN